MEQLSGVALENSLERLWGTGLKHSSFGATALRRCFGEQLWEVAAGNRFGEQLCGAGLIRSSFARQLRTAALKNRSFGEQLWALALGSSFGEKLSAVTLGSSFREPLWRIALGSSFVEQVWGAALGSTSSL